MQAHRRGLAPWQTRWVALHDDLHLLEILLNAIHASPAYLTEFWSLSADVLSFAEDLQDAYALATANNGDTDGEAAYLGLRRRLMQLQARAQVLTLENEVD